MKKYIIGIIAGIMVITLMFISTGVIKGKGGGGEKSMDVCWMQGTTEVRAFFKITGSGLVQQHRYSPNDMHLVFKPKSEFNKPEEGNWFSWYWKGGDYGQYEPCSPPSEYTLGNALGEAQGYWVEITSQYIN